MVRIRLIAGTVLTLGLLVVAGLWAVVAAQQPGTTWTVWAGHATEDFAVFSNDFQPRPLEINAGDTIVFTNGGFHTVAMGRDRVIPFDPATGLPNPAAAFPEGGNVFDGMGVVGSGFLEDPGQEFPVTFTAPGTFTILCDIHQEMEMQVTVRDTGVDLPRGPAEALAAGLDHFWRLDFSGRALSLILRDSQVTTTTTPDGLVVHEMTNGTGDGHVEVIRFLPHNIVIRAGDTVRWVNRDPEAPHTVTFLPGGVLPGPDAPPPSPDDLPPGFPFAPAGGNVYSGAEFINSGALFNDPRFAAASAGSSFDLRFTTPGTFQYLCAFHAEFGQVGSITVLPAPAK